MKKITLVSIMLILVSTIKAQNSCGDILRIKRGGNESNQTPFKRKNIFSQNIKDGDTTYFLEIRIGSSSLIDAPKGLNIIFENGDTIKRINELSKIESGSRNWIYVCSILLTEDELEILKKHRIKTRFIGSMESELNIQDSEEFLFHINCILN